jgi:AcrR family transcriptional regulator
MSDEDVKRGYNSPLRAQRALETRRRIRAVAEALFLRDGYAATSMKKVAGEAGVAERTLYLNFPTKAELLNELIRVAVRGHDREEPLVAGEGFAAVVDAPEGELLREFARMTAALMSRTARLLAIGEAAATVDPALREFRDRGHAATRADVREVADVLGRRGELAPGVTPQRAADTMFGVAGTEALYLRFVDECGWSDDDYAQVLERLLSHLVI